MNELNGSALAFESSAHRWRLVVADEAVRSADGLSGVLRRMGHEVVTADDGRRTLSAHLWFRPDAYILDLEMPQMDGYQTCRTLRNMPGGESLAIVALSGWGRQEDLTHSLEAGFSSFLLKPAHPRDIVRSLSDIWSRRVPPDRLFLDS